MSLENTPVTLAATGVTLNAEIRPGDDDSPVICLHGIWDDSKYFVELALEGAFPGQKMYLLDLRGHGESDKPEVGYGLNNYADDIIAFITERRMDNVVLVGHSLGALTSLLVAAEMPDRIRAMVLEDPPIPLRSENMETFATLVDLKQKSFETVVDEIKAWRPFITQEQAEDTARRLQQTADGVLAEAAKDLSITAEVPAPGVMIPAPTLVIQAGNEDQRAFGSEGSGILGAVLPNLTIETIPDTSHNVLREKPEQYRDLVQEWWNGVQPA
ncbi:MAG: alpha/beta hydrolase [Thermomicrobiales bacterium]